MSAGATIRGQTLPRRIIARKSRLGRLERRPVLWRALPSPLAFTEGSRLQSSRGPASNIHRNSAGQISWVPAYNRRREGLMADTYTKTAIALQGGGALGAYALCATQRIHDSEPHLQTL